MITSRFQNAFNHLLDRAGNQLSIKYYSQTYGVTTYSAFLGSFGNWSSGLSDTNTAGYNNGTWFYNANAGSIDSIYLHVTEGNNTWIQCGIYQYSPGSALLGTTGSVQVPATTPTWYKCPFSSPLSVSAGSYILAFNSKLDITYNYVSGTNKQTQILDPFPITNTSWTGGSASFAGGGQFGISMYATYSGLNPIFTANTYDDDITLAQSGNTLWTSGIVLTLNQLSSSEDAVLLEQGKLITDDKKVFIAGSIALTGSILQVKVQIGSPTGEQFSIIPIGTQVQQTEGNNVYKKVYLRRLTTGSLLGET